MQQWSSDTGVVRPPTVSTSMATVSTPMPPSQPTRCVPSLSVLNEHRIVNGKSDLMPWKQKKAGYKISSAWDPGTKVSVSQCLHFFLVGEFGMTAPLFSSLLSRRLFSPLLTLYNAAFYFFTLVFYVPTLTPIPHTARDRPNPMPTANTNANAPRCCSISAHIQAHVPPELQDHPTVLYT